MRKLGLLTVGLSLLLGWGLHGQTPQDESRAIIKKAMKAHGGEAKLAAIKAMQLKGKGKLHAMGMEIPFTIDVSTESPDKSKAVIDVDINNMKFTIINILNGKKGWNNIMGMTKAMDDKELAEAQEQAHVEEVASLVPLKDKRYKLSPLGETKVEGRDAVGVQVTTKGRRDVNLFFDKKTHLLVKSENRALDPFTKEEVAQEKIYRDYKANDGGLKYPTKMVINHDGKKFIEMEITETTPMENRFDASVFAKP